MESRLLFDVGDSFFSTISLNILDYDILNSFGLYKGPVIFLFSNRRYFAVNLHVNRIQLLTIMPLIYFFVD